MRRVRRPQKGVGWWGGPGQESALLQEAQDVAGGQRFVGGGGALVGILGGILLLLGPAVLEPNLDLRGHTQCKELKLLLAKRENIDPINRLPQT